MCHLNPLNVLNRVQAAPCTNHLQVLPLGVNTVPHNVQVLPYSVLAILYRVQVLLLELAGYLRLTVHLWLDDHLGIQVVPSCYPQLYHKLSH